MSSLANALGQSTQSRPYGTAYTSTQQQDVKMDIVGATPKVEDTDAYIGVGREGVDDLFGNEDTRQDGDIKSESLSTVTPPESGYDSDSLSQTEREHRRALEYAEPDEPNALGEQIQEANVSIPNVPIPRSSDGQYWIIRMPNFVKVDSKPFHPDTYVGPEQDEEEANHNDNGREKSMTIKLKVENTLRWRWVKGGLGQDKRQSNSRIIRWSDGSLSLRLGKELFHISQTLETSGNPPHSSQGTSQPSMSQSTLLPSQQPLPGPKSQGGLTYLVAQHKRSEVLQAEAAITGYMSLRPTGMQSETHRMLVRAVGQKHNKVARLRMAPDPTMDPEREKIELMKLSAKKSRKKADDGSSGARKRRGGYSRKRNGTDVWSDDEEPEFEGSDAEDDGSRATKRTPSNEKRKGPGEYQEDDFVVADESDEDAGFSEAGSNKKRRHNGEDEEDPLDRLEAKISQLEHERKRKDQVTGDAAEDGEDMEVESEEDEEEQRVRKAGLMGARKKRAMAFDEEEE